MPTLIGCILLKSVCFFRPTPLNSFVSLRFCLRQQQRSELYAPSLNQSTPPPQNSATFRTKSPKSLICNISATPTFLTPPRKTRANSCVVHVDGPQKIERNPKNHAKRPASGAFGGNSARSGWLPYISICVIHWAAALDGVFNPACDCYPPPCGTQTSGIPGRH